MPGREVALALDESGRHDARADHLAAIDAPRQLGENGVVVAQVPDGRHAAGDLLDGVPARLVAVHVEEPGKRTRPPASSTVAAAWAGEPVS